MIIHSDLDKLISVLPTYIKEYLQNHKNQRKLVEIIVDLGRRPEGRFTYGTEYIADKIVSWQDFEYCLKRLGNFNNENRAGIKQTLHRISCIKNRQGSIIGLTYRVGRCVIGSVSIIRDLLNTNDSLLLLGKPGIGKTTVIREISRVFADEEKKRVVIIDTANEIAGDSDIPHIGIGQARRLHVYHSENQHEVMKESIENHTPQVIIVDEIGTELEVMAARTMAEKGVQFIGTAHGKSLENIIKNPILSELIGGIQSVILSDEEAKRRKTQKTVLERKTLSAFQVAIELNTKNFWTIHEELENSVDFILEGLQPKLQTRVINIDGQVIIKSRNEDFNQTSFIKSVHSPLTIQVLKFLPKEKKCKNLSIYSYFLSTNRIIKICKILFIKPLLTKKIDEADIILVSKKYFKENNIFQNDTNKIIKKVYLITSNNSNQIKHVLKIIIKKICLVSN
jgi:stage III sporulation protein SpoIIIAA